MRNQYISQSRRSGSFHYRHLPTDTEVKMGDLEFTVGQLFSRSDVVVNPKVNGFRAPSSYSASRRFNNTDGGNRVWIGTAEVPSIVPSSTWGSQLEFRGDAGLIWNRASKNESPPFNSTQELRMKVLNNLQKEIVDVAMVLAEIGSTATTGAALMHRIGRSMQAIARKDMRVFEKLWSGKHPRDSRGRPLKGRYLDRFNRQTAGMYLEWKYGIMPTIYDLQGIVAALDINEAGSLWSSPPLLVARATNGNVNTYGATGYVHEPGGTTPPVDYIIEDRVTHKARLDYRVEHDLMRGLNRYGLGLTSIATVAWDKTPFTFVFDMVVPIAQIIKAWGAMAGVNPVGYCETWHVDRRIKPTKNYAPNGRGPGLDVLRLTSDSEMIMKRVAYPSVPMPLPFIRNPVKVGNIATVLSLFTQMRAKGY